MTIQCPYLHRFQHTTKALSKFYKISRLVTFIKLFFQTIIYACTFAKLHLLFVCSFLHTPAFLQKNCMRLSPERKNKFTTTNAWMWLRINRRKCRVECLRFCIWNLVFLFIRRNSFSLKCNASLGVIQPSATNFKMEAALIAGLHLSYANDSIMLLLIFSLY